MATVDGARALGLEPGLGTLAPGTPADLTVVDLSGTEWLPWDDPESAVVYGGTPARVVLTMVAGGIRFRRGTPRADTSPAHAVRSRMISG
jgi:5-methylthioadenosine/S-adenosylhomocysteine deaminase